MVLCPYSIRGLQPSRRGCKPRQLHLRRNILDNKLHEYYFAVNTFLEFPEIKEHEVRQLIYDEFGKRDKTFEVQVTTSLAKKQAVGRNNYDN